MRPRQWKLVLRISERSAVLAFFVFNTPGQSKKSIVVTLQHMPVNHIMIERRHNCKGQRLINVFVTLIGNPASMDIPIGRGDRGPAPGFL